ncbi:MAG: putative quinol monooxygenase [Enterobacterales bacterium endosymbiont of Blomia tropicalis]|uniref:putative quinol monooxygenase n=1 Tax=Mixta mediterraneensis TaxID=2758443 RepID=UPI00187486F5|nr:putative quinol monooxygenase [Mixta mediterraneensis]MBE5254018.1 antibiotic biosynthesis monooxygenase [Mixta mediterraneensis]MDL4913977.1 putative quinol monooxygenase [Mixta mediterraneensis]
MLTVVAEICVKPGRRQVVLDAIQQLIPTVLDEEGCHQYDALVDHQAQVPWKHNLPDSIFMLEKWESLRHLEQHQQMLHMEEHRGRIKDDVVDVKILVLEPTA